MAKLIPEYTEIGTVPVKFSENILALHETMASGEIDGTMYEVCNAWGFVYVTFRGKNQLKGSLPKIQVDMEDLVRAAYSLAKEKNLFK